jgi:hypothetical protein
MRPTDTKELFISAAIGLLAEGVVVLMFFATVILWMAIGAGQI